VPLDGVDDLKGLKMRAPEGPIANVFAAFGAAPVNLPSSEVYTSIDKGVVDAADYSVFSVNQAQGRTNIGTETNTKLAGVSLLLGSASYLPAAQRRA